jgi:hypothetical protein
MVKYVLLRQCIPGRTFDYFRMNGYDIVSMVESDDVVDVKAEALERIIAEHAKSKAVESAVAQGGRRRG